MALHQHLVLANVVPHAQWQSSRHDVLHATHAKLQQRAHQQGLNLTGEPEETVEILPGNTKVRITLHAEGVLLLHPVSGPR